MPAAVVRVAAALDEALLLELVEEADELAAVVAERVGDRALRLVRALVEREQDRVVVRVEPGSARRPACDRSFAAKPSRLSRKVEDATSSSGKPRRGSSRCDAGDRDSSCEKCSAHNRCAAITLRSSTILEVNYVEHLHETATRAGPHSR